jgi:hypothetical protein
MATTPGTNLHDVPPTAVCLEPVHGLRFGTEAVHRILHKKFDNTPTRTNKRRHIECNLRRQSPRLIDRAVHARSNFGAAFATQLQYVWVRLMQGPKIGLKSVQVMSALDQLLRGVAWGKLDVMVVDMPPGTGDAQISISQKVPLAGEQPAHEFSFIVNHMLATAH